MECRPLKHMSRPEEKCKSGMYGDKMLTRTLGNKRNKVRSKWMRLDYEEMCKSNFEMNPFLLKG
jgi:hypothetical protein